MKKIILSLIVLCLSLHSYCTKVNQLNLNTTIQNDLDTIVNTLIADEGVKKFFDIGFGIAESIIRSNISISQTSLNEVVTNLYNNENIETYTTIYGSEFVNSVMALFNISNLVQIKSHPEVARLNQEEMNYVLNMYFQNYYQQIVFERISTINQRSAGNCYQTYQNNLNSCNNSYAINYIGCMAGGFVGGLITIFSGGTLGPLVGYTIVVCVSAATANLINCHNTQLVAYNSCLHPVIDNK